MIPITLLVMYRWTNRDSQIGREIADVLKARGYGYYVYSSKSNWIGYTEQSIPISDVVSSSDTYNKESGSGMLLGEYAGRGLGYDESKSFSYESDTFGWWISIESVVPVAGYSQAIDGNNLCIQKHQFYSADFDGLGYEVTPKSVIVGSVPFGSASINLQREGFGLIPRYSSLKVAFNKSNGGFGLRSRKRIFDTYCLDKEIDVGEREVSLVSTSSSADTFGVRKVFNVDDFPTCGDYWRYINRYPWLGKFDRIFADADSRSEFWNKVHSWTMDDSYATIQWSDEQFIIHNVVNLQSFAPMLPIAETFGTEDDETGSFNDSVTKV